MRGLLLALGCLLAAGSAHAQHWSTAPVLSGGGNSGVLASAPAAAGGRLTLTSHTPVLSGTGVTGASTIIYTAYVGNLVTVFNGSADVALAIPNNEVSDALQASGSGLASNANVFDIWAVASGGAMTICHATNGAGGGWASDTGGSNTARGTGYSQLDFSTRAYPTNANALANCYNGTTNLGSIAANRATYLGSFTTTAAGQTSVTLGPPASGGTLGVLGIWNYYNRVDGRSGAVDNGAPYTYTTATIREARGSTTNAGYFVTGVAQDAITISLSSQVTLAAVAGAGTLFGFGLDTTTAFTANQPFFCVTDTALGVGCGGTTARVINPLLGLHFIAALERGDGANANTFNANSGNLLDIGVRY